MKVARVYTRKKRAADITWSTQETKNPDEKVNVEKVSATSYTRSFFYGGRERAMPGKVVIGCPFSFRIRNIIERKRRAPLRTDGNGYQYREATYHGVFGGILSKKVI
eukprot:TRINITY_DN2442_c0_g1_i8.p1 TRINITY_DN2442_c0_g1~~TRINITY_DN2442_c0_g1_i8.p1  ORF type:complete len:107 (+),score=14.02 TRINITY_DN2442_c0_g1_i8:1065-1385(+)